MNQKSEIYIMPAITKIYWEWQGRLWVIYVTNMYVYDFWVSRNVSRVLLLFIWYLKCLWLYFTAPFCPLLTSLGFLLSRLRLLLAFWRLNMSRGNRSYSLTLSIIVSYFWISDHLWVTLPCCLCLRRCCIMLPYLHKRLWVLRSLQRNVVKVSTADKTEYIATNLLLSSLH